MVTEIVSYIFIVLLAFGVSFTVTYVRKACKIAGVKFTLSRFIVWSIAAAVFAPLYLVGVFTIPDKQLMQLLVDIIRKNET